MESSVIQMESINEILVAIRDDIAVAKKFGRKNSIVSHKRLSALMSELERLDKVVKNNAAYDHGGKTKVIL